MLCPQACRFALRMCGPNLECEELAAAFQKHLQEGWSLHFGEFLNTTCKHLVRGRAARVCVCACARGSQADSLSVDAPLPGPAGPPGEHQPVLLQKQLGGHPCCCPHAHG